MTQVNAVRHVRTQSERWDYLLSGHALVYSDSSGLEGGLILLNGILWDTRHNIKSDLNLNEQAFDFNLSMKEEKTKKFLYVYSLGHSSVEEFGFYTDGEFEKFKNSDIVSTVKFEKHENVWRYV